jgi:hypothetical protein
MIHPHIAALLSHPAIRTLIERALAARGSHGDTMLAHIGPQEAAMLHNAGGVGTINPRTGLRQFYGSDVGGPSTSDVGGPGNVGGGLGAIADAAARAAGNMGFGRGDPSSTNPGGYGVGVAGDVRGIGGGGFGRPGDGGALLQRVQQAVATAIPPQPIAPLPSQTPVAPPPLVPLMSQASPDLTGGAFGGLPAWATSPYQIAMAPASYPTPGVNPGIGWPMTGGSTIPGSMAPGGAGGAVGGGTTSSQPQIVPGNTPVLRRGQRRAGTFPLAQWVGGGGFGGMGTPISDILAGRWMG